MTQRERIVEIVRGYVGTPYHHQARVPGVGIDCVGIVVCVAREIGVIGEFVDYTDYKRFPVDDELLEILDSHLERLPDPQLAEPGDVLTFRLGKWPHHVAIKTSEDMMVHSYYTVGRVVETRIPENLAARICAAHRFPEGGA